MFSDIIILNYIKPRQFLFCFNFFENFHLNSKTL